jgi:hypothetical protein
MDVCLLMGYSPPDDKAPLFLFFLSPGERGRGEGAYIGESKE